MRKLLVVVVSAALALGLAGAAGASTAAKPPVKLKGDVNDKGTGVVKGGKAKLEADNFYFKKTFLKGKAGSTVSVEIKNDGTVAHTFTIDAQHIDKELQPGDSATVNVKIPKNGKPANFYCRFHVGSGMQGALFSTAGATAGTKKKSTDSSGGGYGY
jgi:plastocyanin